MGPGALWVLGKSRTRGLQMTYRQQRDAIPRPRQASPSTAVLLVAGCAAVSVLALVSLAAAGSAFVLTAAAMSLLRPSHRNRGGCRTCREQATRSAAAERARLARGLHDSLGKTVDGIALAAEALARTVCHDRPDLADHAGQIAAAAGQASREARQLMTGLRDTSAGHYEPLQDAVERMAHRWAALAPTRWTVQVAVAGLDAQIDSNVRHELLLIVDEALANTARHAEATRVRVSVAVDGHLIAVTVRDDGRGFDSASVPSDRPGRARYGLIGMRERAELLGGTLCIGHGRQGGTELRVLLPLAGPPGQAEPGARAACCP
ncbi:signal transduction histidine kinase [Streptomyces sp. TLI_235]|nr:ATP-binding protein [Streptomyces sp. TLI_235]PBC69622.1 signal transduction histidine kinase [Streptomyces sp. TLI_235]